ncbi:hypothetical protein GCM10011352_40840 [Marinobacterium zhoushanense]|uniref:Uncharacterized protein n=1 Tax=Marinobacterium zhoushanense TaxID=1679163 RepID=A0ABQ1KT48_9GAMM|nr:hypothetical protein [Marinobacterium zhoushanense]GGC10217.1 hypothetical protein GCM10011352_40840 [Marinobacterium zhoushanense]
MNVALIRKVFAIPSAHGGNSLPQDEKVNSAYISENIIKSSKQVDLRDVSINEINTLIKSGKTELLDVLPFIPPHIVEQNKFDPESIQSHRLDLLYQLESSIDFKKSIGENTAFLEELFEKIKSIDGAYLPAKIDTIA